MNTVKCPTCGFESAVGVTTCPKDGTSLIEPTSIRPSRPPEGSDNPAVPAPDPGAAQTLVGQKIGDYLVEGVLGEGGMGVVYRGIQPLIGKRVAIKLLRWEIARDPEQMRRLLAEARAVNAIRHRGIIDIFGFGEIPDGRQYIVMELLEGTPLDRLIAKQAPLPLPGALSILDDVLDALEAAHGVGVIHRDLKPSNIFVVQPHRGARYMKLLDFGLAKQAQVPGGSTPQTRASMLVGTPHYMAPEQARGLEVGPGTDLYALGVIAFELVTGRLPFLGDTPFDVIHAHLREQPPAPSTVNPAVPPAFDQLVLQLMAKEPSQRPPSAAEVRDRFGGLRNQESVPPQARPPSPAVQAPAPATAAVSKPAEPPLLPTLEERRTSEVVQVRRLSWPIVVPALVILTLGFAWLLRPYLFPASETPAVVSLPPPAPSVIEEKKAPPLAEEPETKLPEAAPAILSLESNVPCAVAEDGRALGRTPVAARQTSAGKHSYVCRNDFGGEAALDVQLASGKNPAARFAFRPGRLAVDVLPYADVKIDGKPHGTTPFPAVELASGTHRIELTLEKKTLVRSAVVKAGETAHLRVSMEAER